MGIAGILSLKPQDVVAFLIAALLGYFAGTLVPAGAWSTYISILLSYHLFLGWLILSADQTGVSLPIASTVLTHLACMIVVLALGMARGTVPFFGVLRFSIAGFAVFERGWLFSGRGPTPAPVEVPAAAPAVPETGEDFEEWRRYLAQRGSAHRAPGSSLKAEYEQWLLARAQSREAQSRETQSRVAHAPQDGSNSG